MTTPAVGIVECEWMFQAKTLVQYMRQIILVLYSVHIRVAVMRVINFSEARNHLKNVIDRVVNDADVAVITRRDADDAVVMSLDHFNSLMETVHLLKSPANVAHLSKSIEQYRAGKTQQHELVDD